MSESNGWFEWCDLMVSKTSLNKSANNSRISVFGRDVMICLLLLADVMKLQGVLLLGI